MTILNIHIALHTFFINLQISSVATTITCFIAQMDLSRLQLRVQLLVHIACSY